MLTRRSSGQTWALSLYRKYWLGLGLLLALAPIAYGQAPAKPFAAKFQRGFVFDERLSALRQQPEVTAPIIQRLRRGRSIYLLESRRDAQGILFYRVAVTRRTRGWLLAAAVAFPAKAGDDARVLALAEANGDLERLSLCRLLLTRFPRSSLRPQALLLFGEEAEQIASQVLRRANRRMSDDDKLKAPGVPRAYYFLNDVGLDRYNRIGVRFGYDETADKYFYRGDSYRELVRLYPKSLAAIRARAHLTRLAAHQPNQKKLAGQED